MPDWAAAILFGGVALVTIYLLIRLGVKAAFRSYFEEKKRQYKEEAEKLKEREK